VRDLSSEEISAGIIQIRDVERQICTRSAKEITRQRILLLPKRRVSGEIGEMDLPVLEAETEKRLDNLLQLCMKAGKLVCGIDATLRLISRNRIVIVIYSADLADNTREKLLLKCEDKKVTAFCHSTKEGLGNLFNRRATGVLSISDRNFAKGIQKILKAKKLTEADWEV